MIGSIFAVTLLTSSCGIGLADVVTEYRITLPFSVKEYEVGLRYTITEYTKRETGGGEGFEVITDEPANDNRHFTPKYRDIFPSDQTFSQTQYSHKVITLSSKVPRFLRLLAPRGTIELHEKSWNTYPFTYTEYTNPEYMKDKYYTTVTSVYLPDRGEKENVFGLEGEDLARREVVKIDIAGDVAPMDYSTAEDPTRCPSAIGHLIGDWQQTCSPVMTAYKLETTRFVWFGLQDYIEKRIDKSSHRIERYFHRKAFCLRDNWSDLTIADIEKIEDETDKELEDLRLNGPVQGMIEK